MFITGYCSFLAQSCTVLPQSCGFNRGVSYTLTLELGVCACYELTVWELSSSHITDEETETLRSRGRNDSWTIPMLNFHMPKDSVLLYLPSVFDLFEGGAVSQRSCNWNSCLCHWPNYKQLSGTYPQTDWSSVSLVKKKQTVNISLDR